MTQLKITSRHLKATSWGKAFRFHSLLLSLLSGPRAAEREAAKPA